MLYGFRSAVLHATSISACQVELLIDYYAAARCVTIIDGHYSVGGDPKLSMQQTCGFDAAFEHFCTVRRRIACILSLFQYIRMITILSISNIFCAVIRQ